MRADAQRNRDQLIREAIATFTAEGTNASLEDIAARAGVGVGTLYRHFPTRADLIAAASATWESDIDAAVKLILTRTGDPVELLSSWFFALTELMRLQRGYASRIIIAIDRPDSPMHRKSALLVSANEQVVRSISTRAASSVSSSVVCRLVGAVADHADMADLSDAQIRELLEVVARGVLHIDARALAVQLDGTS